MGRQGASDDRSGPGTLTERDPGAAVLGPGARGLAKTVGFRGLRGLGEAIRPWLAASLAGDLSDIASTFVSRDGLPKNSAVATAAVAGGSAALTAAVAASLDE